ncbi:MAG: hypothetical protein QOJ39_2306 [Candidatus Eremiobacteraeota bacterium]|jgi:hypothetical protein|nr:hypothetical protein [Candidatus Eremiobacteraeota bacterium]
MRYIASLLCAVAVYALGVVGGGAAAVTTGLDTLLVPNVHPDETFRYNALDRLSGGVVHSQSRQIVYRVLSAKDGGVSFRREIPGKGNVVLERDASGNLTVGPNGKPGIAFFVPRQFLGDPPNPLAPGQTWQVRLDRETALGSPGTASLSVVSIDPATRHVVLRATMLGEGDENQMTPGDTSPTRFHTVSKRHATIELTNGIVDSFVATGDDKQSANGSTPISVHVELSVKRTK